MRHSCKFCYYRNLDDDPDPFHGMRVAKFLPTEHILDLARSLKANGFIGFDVTGGEPCLHPGIVELAARQSVSDWRCGHHARAVPGRKMKLRRIGC
jgi:organic radical activating enzyme